MLFGIFRKNQKNYNWKHQNGNEIIRRFNPLQHYNATTDYHFIFKLLLLPLPTYVDLVVKSFFSLQIRKKEKMKGKCNFPSLIILHEEFPFLHFSIHFSPIFSQIHTLAVNTTDSSLCYCDAALPHNARTPEWSQRKSKKKTKSKFLIKGKSFFISNFDRFFLNISFFLLSSSCRITNFLLNTNFHFFSFFILSPNFVVVVPLPFPQFHIYCFLIFQAFRYLFIYCRNIHYM